MEFSASGVEVAFWIPPLVAFVISCFTATGGMSGAFLLLPFQMSVLGFVSPAVTPTNHLFNVVAIPSGVYRYIREGRMTWPLAWVIVAGTVPGVLLGSVLRIWLLPDPKHFKLFVGCVLLYVGGRMLGDALSASSRKGARTRQLEKAFSHAARHRNEQEGSPGPSTCVEMVRFSLRRAEYTFYGETFCFSPLALFFITLFVGVVGGMYGIGGGAIIVPILVAYYRLPVYTIAGPALLGTLITSLSGVLFFCLLAGLAGEETARVLPDWSLGLLFGVGGFLGMYVGARAQRYVPARLVKSLLGVLVLSVALRYIVMFFL